MDNGGTNQLVMAKLVVLSKGFSGKTCDIGGERITIGRRDDNKLPIAEGSVSGRHCEIRLREGKVFVKDLGSTNGTFIGERKVEGEVPLPAGAVLRVGQVDIRFETGDGSGISSSLDKTIVLKQGGVKLDDLENTQSVSIGKDKPFTKKRNQINRVFTILGVVMVVVILVFLGFALSKLTGN